MIRVTFCILVGILLSVADGTAQGYNPPKFEKSVFDLKKLGLMEVERQKFATNLAGYVVNEVEVSENKHKAAWAQKMLGLALHLDNRNRAALVANHQFRRGVSPKKVEVDYNTPALATLFRLKSIALVKLGGDDNIYLAGLLLAAAVEMDPKNEDAVYELELYKLDVGEVDWEPITDAKARKPVTVAKDK